MGFYIEALNQTGDGQHGLFSVRLDKEIQWKSKSRSLFYLNIQWETLVGDRKAWDWAIHKELSRSRQKGRERERERDFEKKDSVLQVNWDQFQKSWAELGHVVELLRVDLWLQPSPVSQESAHKRWPSPIM